MSKLVIEPKIMRNICITAHPLGCKKSVESQIAYVKKNAAASKPPADGPKNVLVIGGSAGYGLATRIACAYAYGAKTLNVAFESPANIEKKRPASVGWYNSAAFDAQAAQDGLWAKSIFGDAFSTEIKNQTIDLIKKELGTVDLVVYSLASGKRPDPQTGEMYSSVLKPIGAPFSERTLDVTTGEIKTVTVEAATEEEIAHTVKVMGGEDWKLWVEALADAGVLAQNSTVLAYSYIGPELTYALYRHGTIGKAKEDLEATAHDIDAMLLRRGLGRAYVSVNKALVTRASMVIPVVPLYLSILYKVMKEKGTHEGCIEQMYRLVTQKLYAGKGVATDSEQRIRLDDWEMRDEIQAEVAKLWTVITEDTLARYADVDGFTQEFYQIHGFRWDGVNYAEAVEV